MSNSDQAIVIKDLWGKVLSTLAVMGIAGGMSFAFAQNATNAEIKTHIELVNEKTKAQDDRLNKMDTKIDGVQKSVNDVREHQARIETKLDILLDKAK